MSYVKLKGFDNYGGDSFHVEGYGEVTFEFRNRNVKETLTKKFGRIFAGDTKRKGYTQLMTRVDYALSHLFHTGTVIRVRWGYYRNVRFNGTAKRVIATETA